MKKFLLIVLSVTALILTAYLAFLLYQNYQARLEVSRLHDAQQAYLQAQDPSSKTALRVAWFELLNRRVENKTVETQEIRDAISVLNLDTEEDVKDLLFYLKTLDVLRNTQEQVLYAQLLYRQNDRQLNDEIEDVISSILRQNPKQADTLLILIEQALRNKEYDLIQNSLDVVKSQLPAQSKLQPWVQKLEQQFAAVKPAQTQTVAAKEKQQK